MSRADMLSEVQTITDRTDYSTNAQTRLQWALNEIAEAKPWPVLQIYADVTLVNDTSEYDKPATLKTINRIIHTKTSSTETGRYLERVTPEDFHDRYPYPAGNTTADTYVLAWTYDNAKIMLNRPAVVAAADSGNLVLRCYGSGFPNTLGDSTASNLPEEIDEAIIYLAASKVFDILEEEQKASYWQAKAYQVVNRVWRPYSISSYS